MSNQELINLCQSLYEGVYVFGCYGIRDYQLMVAAEEELRRMGYKIVRRVEVVKKEEVDNPCLNS